MAVVELKKCPFCGGDEIIAEIDQTDKCFRIYCANCPVELKLTFADAQLGNGSLMDFYETQKIMEELQNMWNRRYEDV